MVKTKKVINSSSTIPISYLFPNIVTIVSLCFGMSSVKYALDSRWELSIGLLVISAFLDGMDGRLARFLNASSKFGAELDSLTDFINFGIAPAFILYLWGLIHIPIKGLGWAIAIIYSICCALRLARYNTLIPHQKEDIKESHYFKGIPAPSGAGLTLVPIMITFSLDIKFFADNPLYLGIYLLIIAFFMASQIPTFSLKNINIPNIMLLPLLITATIMIIGLIIRPWITLPLMGVLYLFFIPISTICYYKKK